MAKLIYDPGESIYDDPFATTTVEVIHALLRRSRSLALLVIDGASAYRTTSRDAVCAIGATE